MSDDEYKFDLFWHALNYRGASTKEAQQMWEALEACVARIVDKEVREATDAQSSGEGIE